MTKHLTTGQHPLYAELRNLRKGMGMSLEGFAARFDETSVVIGSYERGDRQPSVAAFDRILRHLGRKLAIVPDDAPDAPQVWTDAEMVAALRGVAAQLESARPAAREVLADVLARVGAQRGGGA